VDVRVIGTPEQIEAAGTLLQQALGHAILPEEMRTLEHYLVSELAHRKLRLATVESCTGGALANRVTHVPGSSAVFGYGYVTYANEAKRDLGVPAALLEAASTVDVSFAVLSQQLLSMCVDPKVNVRRAALFEVLAPHRCARRSQRTRGVCS
jgi:nicotinamide-nucleotide amidase